jgi:hypothetical protein
MGSTSGVSKAIARVPTVGTRTPAWSACLQGLDDHTGRHRSTAKRLRAEMALVRQDLRRLGDKAVVKTLLRRERQRRRDPLMYDDFF